jgi:hypothetical protein
MKEVFTYKYRTGFGPEKLTDLAKDVCQILILIFGKHILSAPFLTRQQGPRRSTRSRKPNTRVTGLEWAEFILAGLRAEDKRGNLCNEWIILL